MLRRLPARATPGRTDGLEECARHVDHADLIRESVDGLVGEAPPR